VPSAAAAALIAPVERASGFTTVPLASSAAASAAPTRSPEEIGEMAPQIARARAIAVTKTAPSRRLQPGDLICGMCGEGNPPTRRFCSRCGSSLIEAVRVRESWWRRLLRWLFRWLWPRRGPKVVALDKVRYRSEKDGTSAGSAAHLAKPMDLKKKVRHAFLVLRRIITVMILLGGVLYGAYPPFRHSVNSRVQSLKHRLFNDIGANLSPIHAVSVTADVTSPGSSPLFAADELLNTYWLAPWSNTKEPSLTFTFAHRVTLKRMILHSGAGNSYVQHGRPSDLLLKFSNGETATIVPQDTSQAQTFSVGHADIITSVQIQVTGVDPGSADSDVAITEIELFGYTL
jgi:hypothetical protein